MGCAGSKDASEESGARTRVEYMRKVEAGRRETRKRRFFHSFSQIPDVFSVSPAKQLHIDSEEFAFFANVPLYMIEDLKVHFHNADFGIDVPKFLDLIKLPQLRGHPLGRSLFKAALMDKDTGATYAMRMNFINFLCVINVLYAADFETNEELLFLAADSNGDDRLSLEELQAFFVGVTNFGSSQMSTWASEKKMLLLQDGVHANDLVETLHAVGQEAASPRLFNPFASSAQLGTRTVNFNMTNQDANSDSGSVIDHERAPEDPLRDETVQTINEDLAAKQIRALCETLLKEFDLDNDGHLCFEEFFALVRHLGVHDLLVARAQESPLRRSLRPSQEDEEGAPSPALALQTTRRLSASPLRSMSPTFRTLPPAGSFEGWGSSVSAAETLSPRNFRAALTTQRGLNSTLQSERVEARVMVDLTHLDASLPARQMSITLTPMYDLGQLLRDAQHLFRDVDEAMAVRSGQMDKRGGAGAAGADAVIEVVFKGRLLGLIDRGIEENGALVSALRDGCCQAAFDRLRNEPEDLWAVTELDRLTGRLPVFSIAPHMHRAGKLTPVEMRAMKQMDRMQQRQEKRDEEMHLKRRTLHQQLDEAIKQPPSNNAKNGSPARNQPVVPPIAMPPPAGATQPAPLQAGQPPS